MVDFLTKSKSALTPERTPKAKFSMVKKDDCESKANKAHANYEASNIESCNKSASKKNNRYLDGLLSTDIPDYKNGEPEDRYMANESPQTEKERILRMYPEEMYMNLERKIYEENKLVNPFNLSSNHKEELEYDNNYEIKSYQDPIDYISDPILKFSEKIENFVDENAYASDDSYVSQGRTSELRKRLQNAFENKCTNSLIGKEDFLNKLVGDIGKNTEEPGVRPSFEEYANIKNDLRNRDKNLKVNIFV